MSTVHVLLLSLCLAAVPPAALARPAGSAIEQAMGAYERGELETAQRMFEALSRSGLPAADCLQHHLDHRVRCSARGTASSSCSRLVAVTVSVSPR